LDGWNGVGDGDVLGSDVTSTSVGGSAGLGVARLQARDVKIKKIKINRRGNFIKKPYVVARSKSDEATPFIMLEIASPFELATTLV